MKKTTIISDLDGTLYSRNNGLTSQIDSLADSFLSSSTGMSGEQLTQLEKLYPNILDALKVLQIPKSTYYNNVHSRLDYSVLKPDVGMNQLLSSMGLRLFVVSLSPAEHIKKVLSLLDIEHLVDATFSMSKEISSNKGNCYNNILKHYKLSSKEVCVVGDNYHLDIEPAKHLNLTTALISTTNHPGTNTFINFSEFLKHLQLMNS